jgi:hypothetical protein
VRFVCYKLASDVNMDPELITRLEKRPDLSKTKVKKPKYQSYFHARYYY